MRSSWFTARTTSHRHTTTSTAVSGSHAPTSSSSPPAFTPTSASWKLNATAHSVNDSLCQLTGCGAHMHAFGVHFLHDHTRAGREPGLVGGGHEIDDLSAYGETHL